MFLYSSELQVLSCFRNLKFGRFSMMRPWYEAIGDVPEKKEATREVHISFITYFENHCSRFWTWYWYIYIYILIITWNWLRLWKVSFCNKNVSFCNSGWIVDLQVLVKELVLDSAVVDIVLETLGMFGKMKLSCFFLEAMLSFCPVVGLGLILVVDSIIITIKRNE